MSPVSGLLKEGVQTGRRETGLRLGGVGARRCTRRAHAGACEDWAGSRRVAGLRGAGEGERGDAAFARFDDLLSNSKIC